MLRQSHIFDTQMVKIKLLKQHTSIVNAVWGCGPLTGIKIPPMNSESKTGTARHQYYFEIANLHFDLF